MKKKLSRLLCALLVMTMVLAMVPAVSAAAATDKPGTSKDNPIVMYAGDSSLDYENKTFGCTDSSHTREIKYSEYYIDSWTELTSAKYVTYDTSTRAFIASTTPTVKTSNSKVTADGVVKVKVSCKGKLKSGYGTSATYDACTKFTTSETRFYKVYSKATGITLKNSSGTTLNSLNLSVGFHKIYYTLAPVTMNPDNIEVTSRNENVEVLDKNAKVTDGDTKVKWNAWDEDRYGTYFTLQVKKGGVSTKIDITLDGNTSHTAVEKTYNVQTGSAATLTLYNKSTSGAVLASSNDDGESYIDANINDEIVIQASADSVLGSLSDIEWDSSNPEVAAQKDYPSNGKITYKVKKAGKTTISATLGGKTAQLEIRVLSNVTDVEIQDMNGNKMENQERNVYNTLEATLKVWPTKNDDAAHYAVWSISNTDVLDFEVAGNTDYYEGADKKWYPKWTIDPDTGNAEGSMVRMKAKKAGTVTVKVKLGEESDSFKVTVKETATSVTVSRVITTEFYPEVRNGSSEEIRAQLNADAKYQYALVEGTEGNRDKKQTYSVPITWTSASSADKVAYGTLSLSDDNNTYSYTGSAKPTVTAHLTLTDKPAVTDITITANKDVAVENDKVTLTANATAAPASSDVSYQWYVNGSEISKATSKTLSYTIPKSSVDSSTSYKFTCEVTATNKGNSTTATSSAYTITVSRDYSISLAASNGKTAFTVGDDITMKATLYYKGSAVSSTSFSWQLFDANEKNLDAALATITGSGSTATIASKATKDSGGMKVTVRATVDYKGYSYSSSETITINPAEAATVKQSVGSGATLKASSITSAVSKAAGANASYIVFSSPSGCTLTPSASSSSSLGSTKCYVSSSSGQSLSNVYVKTSGSSASVKYTAYNSSDYVIATGTVSFDSDDATESVYASGASFRASGAAEQILEAFPDAAYVKLELPRESDGKLFYDYDSIASYTGEAKDTEKYYFDAGSSQNDVEDVYFLPAYGVTGKIEINYTAYSSSNSSLGDGTVTLNIKKKTASSKFTDVTYNNTGYWAADSIDFMADNGLFTGTSTYGFSPNNPMTRAMLVTVLYRAAGQPSVSGVTNPFTDIKRDYYYNAVLWAYKNNIVTGTSANKFSPDANVTREQIASILYRYMGSPTATGSLVGYTDRTEISAYAATAMQWAIGKGYITGMTATTLAPTGNATRAQVAVMIHRFLTK